MLNDLANIALCPGVTCSELQEYANPKTTCATSAATYYREITNKGNGEVTSTVYSTNCLLELKPGLHPTCKKCTETKALLISKRERTTTEKTVHPCTSLSKLQPKTLISLLKTSRKDNKALQAKLNKKVEEESVCIDGATHTSLVRIMNDNKLENDFLKLFWEEQQKAFNSGNRGMRWHPMMLRFAIMLHSYSPAAYSILRDTGVLKA